MKLEKADERAEIARELDAHDEAWRNVNNIPEVQAARARADEARRAADAAAKDFSRIFDSYTKRGTAARLAEKYPGVILLGEIEADFRWIARCAVTRLPIFAGDLVYIGGGKEDYQRTYILADAVSLAIDGHSPVVIGADGEEDKQKKRIKT